MNDLNLVLIGNSTIAALIDDRADIVWSCMPLLDSDPVFDALLREPDGDAAGRFAVELLDYSHSEQHYEKNTAIFDELPVVADGPFTMVLGPDESPAESVAALGRRYREETRSYWVEWARFLDIPAEWQREVIRAAITLQPNAFEDTGAIIAAVTTSIPEAPGAGATGTIATVGCAMPTSRWRPSTAWAPPRPWSPTWASSSTGSRSPRTSIPGPAPCGETFHKPTVWSV